MYINDIDTSVDSDLSKFADDTKIGRLIGSNEDGEALQKDLDKLFEWSEKWQMQFNPNKCSILSVGRYNPLNKYKLHDTELKRTNCERDLGVMVSPDLQPRKQCIDARLGNVHLG